LEAGRGGLGEAEDSLLVDVDVTLLVVDLRLARVALDEPAVRIDDVAWHEGAGHDRRTTHVMERVARRYCP